MSAALDNDLHDLGRMFTAQAELLAEEDDSDEKDTMIRRLLAGPKAGAISVV